MIGYAPERRELVLAYRGLQGVYCLDFLHFMSDGRRGALSLVADTACSMAMLNPMLRNHVLKSPVSFTSMRSICICIRCGKRESWATYVLRSLIFSLSSPPMLQRWSHRFAFRNSIAGFQAGFHAECGDVRQGHECDCGHRYEVRQTTCCHS